MQFVVGIDAGGTSTRAVLADEEGRCLGFGRTGPGNPTSAGIELATNNIVAATLTAINRSGKDPSLLLLSMAGVLGTNLTDGVAAQLAAAGYRIELHTAGDVVSAYFSATAEPTGYLILSGTGATGAAIVDGQLARVSDGLGWLLGDCGSGFWVGHQAVRAVAADMENRGPTTTLRAAILGAITDPHPRPEHSARSDDLWRLVRKVYDIRPVECAQFAPLVFEAAAAGDDVAADILDRALEGLLSTCESVIGDDDRPVVLAGSLLGETSPLGQGIRARYPGRCLRAQDGTAGAALLALRHLGAAADAEALARITSTLSELVQTTAAGTSSG